MHYLDSYSFSSGCGCDIYHDTNILEILGQDVYNFDDDHIMDCYLEKIDPRGTEHKYKKFIESQHSRIADALYDYTTYDDVITQYKKIYKEEVCKLLSEKLGYKVKVSSENKDDVEFAVYCRKTPERFEALWESVKDEVFNHIENEINSHYLYEDLYCYVDVDYDRVFERIKEKYEEWDYANKHSPEEWIEENFSDTDIIIFDNAVDVDSNNFYYIPPDHYTDLLMENINPILEEKKMPLISDLMGERLDAFRLGKCGMLVATKHLLSRCIHDSHHYSGIVNIEYKNRTYIYHYLQSV